MDSLVCVWVSALFSASFREEKRSDSLRIPPVRLSAIRKPFHSFDCMYIHPTSKPTSLSCRAFFFFLTEHGYACHRSAAKREEEKKSGRSRKRFSLSRFLFLSVLFQKEQVIVFVSSRHQATFLDCFVRKLGLPSAVIYGSMDQEERVQSLSAFRKSPFFSSFSCPPLFCL